MFLNPNLTEVVPRLPEFRKQIPPHPCFKLSLLSRCVQAANEYMYMRIVSSPRNQKLTNSVCVLDCCGWIGNVQRALFVQNEKAEFRLSAHTPSRVLFVWLQLHDLADNTIDYITPTVYFAESFSSKARSRITTILLGDYSASNSGQWDTWRAHAGGPQVKVP